MRHIVLLLSLLVSINVWSQDRNEPRPPPSNEQDKPQPKHHEPNEDSPVRGIERQDKAEKTAETGIEQRTINGTNNNLDSDEMGSAHIQLERLAPADYADGISSLAGQDRPSARVISNHVFSQQESKPNTLGATDFLWQWGQFLDHDIDLTDGVTPRDDIEILIPTGDTYFDPESTGIEVLTINRSLFDESTGSSADNPRQQINEITAWIDASNVYGSDLERTNALRTLDGSGKMKTSAGNLLPFNDSGLINAGGSSESLFVAGDVRANEQIGLTVMHTLFVREHNNQAIKIQERNPSLSGEEIFQQARRIVIAQMQVITYREFLPIILGSDALPRYEGYDSNKNANITNEFSTAAYRFGHTLLSPQILRIDAQGNEIDAGHLPLRNAFFRPDRLGTEGGIDPILRGLANQVCQSIDSYVIDDVRNFLFGAPGAGGFDLAAVNIARGRDHGLASYNETRAALGLSTFTSFEQVSSDPEVQSRLAAAYESVDDIDLWVGGLAEDAHGKAMVGEVFYHILKRQFLALRDGDRFWYQRDLNKRDINRIEKTRLADIIRRNTDIDQEINDNVFLISATPE